MITGIQITKAANDDLLNSFWLLDSEKGEARCLCAKGGFAEDDVVAVNKLGEIEYREIPLDVKPEVRVEGGQHLLGDVAEVWGGQQTGRPAERVVDRQRLDVEHVHRHTTEPTGLQGLSGRDHVDDRAARGVDQQRTFASHF